MMSYPPPLKLLQEAETMSLTVKQKQEELVRKNKEAAKDVLLSIQLILDRRPLRHKYK